LHLANDAGVHHPADAAGLVGWQLCCAGQGRRSPRSSATRAATAALLYRQKPSNFSLAAWWPGGRTTANARCTVPSQTLSTHCKRCSGGCRGEAEVPAEHGVAAGALATRGAPARSPRLVGAERSQPGPPAKPACSCSTVLQQARGALRRAERLPLLRSRRRRAPPWLCAGRRRCLRRSAACLPAAGRLCRPRSASRQGGRCAQSAWGEGAGRGRA